MPNYLVIRRGVRNGEVGVPVVEAEVRVFGEETLLAGEITIEVFRLQ